MTELFIDATYLHEPDVLQGQDLFLYRNEFAEIKPDIPLVLYEGKKPVLDIGKYWHIIQVVTSGTLVAADSLLPPDAFLYFTKSIKPGRYPVIASVAKLQLQQAKSEFEQNERIACVMLRISEKTAVTWESADINGYCVDHAIGSFMDMDAALVLKALYKAHLYEEYRNKLYAQFDEFDYSPFNDYEVVRWASIQVSDTTEANVIAFTSGKGDGGYLSYWGYDKQGKRCCLVTDFTLFTEE